MIEPTRKEKLQGVKVGDRVAVYDFRGILQGHFLVVRITPKQIISVAGKFYGPDSLDRHGRCRAGQQITARWNSLDADHISTPEEIAEWDAKTNKDLEERRVEREEYQKIQQNHQRLSELFSPLNAGVSKGFSNLELTLHEVTEEEIVKIAQFCREQVRIP